MLRFVFIAFVLFFGGWLSAQSPFVAFEDSLSSLQSTLGDSQSDEERIATSLLVDSLLKEMFELPGVYNYPFDRVEGMGIMDSPDGAFRLFNWNVPLNDMSHQYHCYVLKSPDEDGVVEYIELQQMKKEPTRLEMRTFDQDEWLGCLYYDIVPIKKGRSTDYYVLLGWDGHNRITKRKFIEVMEISPRKISFGKAVFKMDKGVKKRIVFEYSTEVSMSCRYQGKQERLVFDHLSPRSAGLEGNPAFYGPDLTFDALELKKGKWELVRDIDVRLDRNRSRRPYNDPRPK